MKSLQEYWNDWTGKTDADRAKENAMNVGAATASSYEQYAKEIERALASAAPWIQRGFDQTRADLAQRLGWYGDAESASLGALAQGLEREKAAGAAQDAQRLGLIREGMGMDRLTLEKFLAQALGAQAPYAGAYQQMVGAALPQILGAMQGTSRMPLSSLAQLQQEDSARSLRANAQRAGLEGSGMASAQTAAANRRIAAEDEQRQMERWLSMLTQGLGGANLTSGLYNTYAQSLGNLCNRLSSFTPYNMAGAYGQAALNQANIYGSTANRRAESLQQANIPQQYGIMGEMASRQIMAPAGARMQGTLANISAQGQAGAIQGPTFFSSLGDLVKLYGSTQGLNLGGGGSNQGYFGQPGDWSSRAYAQGYRGPGPNTVAW